VFKQKKNDRFAYLRWRILNKILIRTQMLTKLVLWWPNLLWEVELCCDWWGFKKKYTRKKEKWGRGEEGRSQCHKLNITDKIILSLTLLVKYHVTIWFAFFNLILLPFVILSGTLLIKVTRHHIVWLFLFLIFPLQFCCYIPTEEFCLSLPMDTGMENSVWKVHRIYRQKNFIGVSIYICQFFGNVFVIMIYFFCLWGF